MEHIVAVRMQLVVAIPILGVLVCIAGNLRRSAEATGRGQS